MNKSIGNKLSLINDEFGKNATNNIINLFNEMVGLLSCAIKLVCSYIKFILKKVRSLPYVVTGTDPYFFSDESKIKTSSWSKTQINLFGWGSLVVVGYVGISSGKIIEQYLGNGDPWLKYAVQSMLATIVFFSDRFILSYPKAAKSIDEILHTLDAKNKTGADKIINEALFFITNKLIRVVAKFVFAAIRIVLALCISGVLVLIVFLQMNESKIIAQIEAVKQDRQRELLVNNSIYNNYTNTLKNERRAYIEIRAIEECQRITEEGVKDKNRIKLDKNIIKDAPIGIYNAVREDFDASDEYTCGASDSRACKSGNCKEYNKQRDRLLEKQKVFSSENRKRIKLEEDLNYELKTNKEMLMVKNLPIDFSMRVEAISKYYSNIDVVKIFYEIIMYAPILIILLGFELIPVAAKIFFPATAYEKLVAWEEVYYDFVTLVPRDKNVREIIDQFLDVVPGQNSIFDLQALDELRKSKDAELKNDTNNFLSAVVSFFGALAKVSFVLTVGLLIILGAFAVVVGVVLPLIGYVRNPVI